MSTATFRRYEIKYRMTAAQAELLLKEMAPYMHGDAYGSSTNYSLYFDTPDHRLVRKSLEGPAYKEKLRLRSYGNAKADTKIFIELKKKYEHITYKRRVSATEKQAIDFLCQGKALPEDSQIARELAYMPEYYEGLQPSIFLSYDREAFFSNTDPNFRMTLDRNIRYRTTDLNLHHGSYGAQLVPEDTVLLEIKTSGAVPLWLTHFLDQHHLYRTHFSKCGAAYQAQQKAAAGLKRYA